MRLLTTKQRSEDAKHRSKGGSIGTNKRGGIKILTANTVNKDDYDGTAQDEDLSFSNKRNNGTNHF